MTTVEKWRPIPGFTNYEVSDQGNVYNVKTNKVMHTSTTQQGHVKISLVSDDRETRHTLSVAQLVAEAFVDPPNVLCDRVAIRNGNQSDVRAENLMWRPRWFVWKYAHQLNRPQPTRYENLPVLNVDTGDEYESIMGCGIFEGLLFSDIWKSTYARTRVYPYGFTYEILNRV